MHEVRNKPRNILFTTEKLTDGMCLCDTAQIMQRLYLFQLKNANQRGQVSAPTTGKHYVGGSLPADSLPENLRNGVSRSRCGFCRIIFKQERELSLK
jgi:hypothetical protein